MTAEWTAPAPRSGKRHVFVVLRFDQLVPGDQDVVATTAYWTRQRAEEEVGRLNGLKPDGTSRYDWVVARLVDAEDGEAAQ